MLHCILYGAVGCHLCDLAEQVLVEVLPYLPLQIELVDIGESQQLVAEYGLRIPVLQRTDTKQELCWPFTSEQAWQFLST